MPLAGHKPRLLSFVMLPTVERIGVHYLRRKDEAEQTARVVEQHGARATLIQADLTKPDDIGRMFVGHR
jgi:hypothetical protein